jgi:TonB family protein
MTRTRPIRRYLFATQLGAVVVSSFLSLLAVRADDRDAVISLNNDGVKDLNKNDCQAAIEKFEAAIKLDPDYQMARDNLAIAHSNYGLQLKDNPDEALKQFHMALYLNIANPTTLEIVEGVVRKLGREPARYKDRVALGDAALNAGDNMSAAVEYSVALGLHRDAAVRKKLSEVLCTLNKGFLLPSPEIVESSLKPKSPIKSPRAKSLLPKIGDERFDSNEFICTLQRRIKAEWLPPESSSSNQVVVTFRVEKYGELKDLVLTKSSGVVEADQAALRAVEDASPFSPLRKGAAKSLDVQFTFAYNVRRSGHDPSVLRRDEYRTFRTVTGLAR